ncbi:MAG: XcyI family restriction endonuclease [Anaerolineae bacterium]
MTDGAPKSLPTLEPDLQISFFFKFREIEKAYLHGALKQAVSGLDIQKLDDQLAAYVDLKCLGRVASFGLRGEVFFATPCVLELDPRLLGYYRLLLGFSKKEFYSKNPFGRFVCLEERGQIRAHIRADIPALCRSLTSSAEILIQEVDSLSLSLIRDLQVLTIGPQLRGGRLNVLGEEAAREVFDLIEEMLSSRIVESSEYYIRVQGEADRAFIIRFAADPDVQITEVLPTGGRRHLVAIEIKGGADVSNVHNRIGEAEKSHQKAKMDLGFAECWTIHRATVAADVAHRESPTTDHFFSLDEIISPHTEAHGQFRARLNIATGIDG